MVHILKNYLCYLSGLEFEMLENYPENRYDVMLKTLKAYENREIPIIIKGGANWENRFINGCLRMGLA